MKSGGLTKIHIFSWILKDVFWCLHFKWAATFMIAPTLIISVISILKEKENQEENIVLLFWILMNSFWMIHELHSGPKLPVYFFMIAGILSSLFFIKNSGLFRKYRQK